MNTEKGRTVRLSGREAMYLKSTAFLSEDLLRIIMEATDAPGGAVVFQLPVEISERFREAFTARLARVGFDKDYEPTNEGKLLESLIDRFYVP